MTGQRRAKTNPYVFYFGFSILLIGLTTYILLSESELSLLAAFGLGVNVAALVCMGFDKSFARSNSMRIPEVVLHVLALIGGVPGILLGIHVFRHKTQKAAFQFVLLLVAAVQVAVLKLLQGE